MPPINTYSDRSHTPTSQSHAFNGSPANAPPEGPQNLPDNIQTGTRFTPNNGPIYASGFPTQPSNAQPATLPCPMSQPNPIVDNPANYSYYQPRSMSTSASGGNIPTSQPSFMVDSPAYHSYYQPGFMGATASGGNIPTSQPGFWVDNPANSSNSYHAPRSASASGGESPISQPNIMVDNRANSYLAPVPPSEKLFICNQCPASFEREGSLRSHKGVHFKDISCLDCKKPFAKKEHLDVSFSLGHTRNFNLFFLS